LRYTRQGSITHSSTSPHAQHHRLLRRLRNEISENISKVLKLYRCLRKTEKTQPQKQRGWPMVERRDVFRICQTLPISDAENHRRPAGGDARTAVRQVLSFIR
jgi:hypothetical protein